MAAILSRGDELTNTTHNNIYRSPAYITYIWSDTTFLYISSLALSNILNGTRKNAVDRTVIEIIRCRRTG